MMTEQTRYALVTGGSRGIGRAICLKLAEMGYSVIVNYQSNRAAAEETKSLIEQNGGSAELLPFDVADGSAVEKSLFDWLSAHADDYISVLVNNAGIRRDNLMFWMQDEEWHSVLDTSLNGTFYTTRALLKYMMNKKFGRIINMVSISGVNGMSGQTNYSAAKAGVIGMTKSLALEAAKKKVTVNAVAPGFIETDMTKDLNQDELKKLVPAQRFGKPEEVAELVAFLASDKANYITGQVINISGGL
ncbi:MAG: 3-oxoacyl-ACP reductase FabG [Dysgonamonadaceae bacterium]|jgi:3-oxoacyl-[acyl-carrier protein] reductase|nr:3-oxoacyl-ACP reductase FabG [Dysgonamonadaceae bacterium]